MQGPHNFKQIISRGLLYNVNSGEGERGFISEDFGLYSIACHDDALDALTEHPHEQGLTLHKLDVDRLSPPTG